MSSHIRPPLPTNRPQRCIWALGVLLAAASTAACGGVDHSAPAPAAADELSRARSDITGSVANHATSQHPVQTTSITQTAGNPEQGLLDLLAISSADQSLGSLSFVVRNRAGAVLTSGFNEVKGPDVDRHLLLQLSAGVDYELALDSTTNDEPAQKCHARVGPFSISADATARYQAFVWQCDEAPTAPAPADSCYWLTDFVGISRTRAAVGETIDLDVSGFDTTGAPADVTWSLQAPQSGSISDEAAAHTTFHCEAASDVIPLLAVVTGDGCSRRVQLNVACY